MSDDYSSASNMQSWLDLIRAPGWLYHILRINDARKTIEHAKTQLSLTIQYFKNIAHPFLKLILHLMIG